MPAEVVWADCDVFSLVIYHPHTAKRSYDVSASDVLFLAAGVSAGGPAVYTAANIQ